MANELNNEWLVMLDDEVPCDKVTVLPVGYAITEDNEDFAEMAGRGYAERVTAARLLVTAVDGKVPAKRFKTYREALEAARKEFAGGEASFDGIRVFDGIQVRVGDSKLWYNVNANLG